MSKSKGNQETSGLKRGEEKFTLLTNIRMVEHNELKLHCRALLLSEGSIGLTEPSWSIRGFGTEASWEVFNRWLPKDAFPYTLTPFVNEMFLLLKDSGRTEPIHTGNILSFLDRSHFRLYASDNTRPLDIHVSTDGDICKVWDILADKTREYWDAPYMPTLNYAPAKIRARNFI